ncbi:MAG TPA: hypothetical protein VK335_07425 [Bryobacteraceae bacterium]|nr:hypothetical protein [Bryobacteraceae bacterium]
MNRLLVSSLIIETLLATAFGAPQQKSAPLPPAPVPAQVLNGKKVFIANAGEEHMIVPIGTILSGSIDRVYDQFYAAINKLGRYELVSAPAEADLIFEIGFTINGSPQIPEIGHLRLSIRDPKTNVLLWSFVEYAPAAFLKGNRDKNLDQTMNVIVGELINLVSPPGAAAKP